MSQKDGYHTVNSLVFNGGFMRVLDIPYFAKEMLKLISDNYPLSQSEKDSVALCLSDGHDDFQYVQTLDSSIFGIFEHNDELNKKLIKGISFSDPFHFCGYKISLACNPLRLRFILSKESDFGFCSISYNGKRWIKDDSLRTEYPEDIFDKALWIANHPRFQVITTIKSLTHLYSIYKNACNKDHTLRPAKKSYLEMIKKCLLYRFSGHQEGEYFSLSDRHKFFIESCETESQVLMNYSRLMRLSTKKKKRKKALLKFKGAVVKILDSHNFIITFKDSKPTALTFIVEHDGFFGTLDIYDTFKSDKPTIANKNLKGRKVKYLNKDLYDSLTDITQTQKIQENQKAHLDDFFQKLLRNMSSRQEYLSKEDLMFIKRLEGYKKNVLEKHH